MNSRRNLIFAGIAGLVAAILPNRSPAKETKEKISGIHLVDIPDRFFHTYVDIGYWCLKNNVFQIGILKLTQDGYRIEGYALAGEGINPTPATWRYMRYLAVDWDENQIQGSELPSRIMNWFNDPWYYREPRYQFPNPRPKV